MNPVTVIGPGTVISSYDERSVVMPDAAVAVREDRIIDVGSFD